MNSVVDELVSELNQTTVLDEMIAKHFPEAKSWKLRVSATDKIMQVAVGPEEARIPKLPMNADHSLPTSMEIRVATTWEQGLVVKTLLLWNNSHDLLREFLPEGDARALAKDVEFKTEGKWFLVKIGDGAIRTVLDRAAEPSDASR